MFEMLTDGQTPDAGVTAILLAHHGELKINFSKKKKINLNALETKFDLDLN